MGQTVELESFDSAPSAPAGPSGDYQRGYEDGQEDATHAAQSGEAALQADLVQAVSDLEFTYEEARSEVMRALGPFLETLISTILPHCVSNGFVSQIMSILRDAAAVDLVDAPTIMVHPSQQQAVAQALESWPANLSVGVDDSLNPYAAWLRLAPEETLLDLDHLMAEISTLIGAATIPNERQESHG